MQREFDLTGYPSSFAQSLWLLVLVKRFLPKLLSKSCGMFLESWHGIVEVIYTYILSHRIVRPDRVADGQLLNELD